jgi:hypothetical protein
MNSLKLLKQLCHFCLNIIEVDTQKYAEKLGSKLSCVGRFFPAIRDLSEINFSLCYPHHKVLGRVPEQVSVQDKLARTFGDI